MGKTSYERILEVSLQQYLLLNKKNQQQKLKNHFEGWRFPALDRFFLNMEKAGFKFDRPSALDRNITRVVHTHIYEVIEHDRNFVGLCIGKSGLGKSVLMIAIADLLRKAHLKFNQHRPKEKQKFPKVHFGFSFDESEKLIEKMNAGDTMIQDELTELVGERSHIVKTQLNNIIRQFRYTQKNYVLNNPDYFYMPNLHLIFSPIGQDESYFESKEKSDMNTRFFVRYIDDSEKSRKPLYLGYAIVNVASIMPLLEEYERKKDENYKRLEASGGARSAKMDVDKIEKYVRELWRVAKEKGWNGKSKKKLGFYLNYTDLNLDSYTKNYVLDEVYEREQKTRRDEEDELYEKMAEIENTPMQNSDKGRGFIEKTTPRKTKKIFSIEDQIHLEIDGAFIVSDNDILDTIRINPSCKDWEDKERNIQIMLLAKEGLTYTQIKEKVKLQNVSSIAQIRKKYQGYLNKYRGRLFEVYYENVLKNTNKYSLVKRDGAKGQPDIYAIRKDMNRLEIFSCKCYDLAGKNSISIPIEEFEPELRFALENYISAQYDDIKVKALIFDSDELKLYEKKINFIKRPKTIPVEKSKL